MEVTKTQKAVLRHVQISPRKARLVIGMIRGKQVDEAEAILHALPHKAAKLILKVVKSAAANAVHNDHQDRQTLKVTKAYINMGTPWRRIQPRGMGRGDIIKKRTSHICVEVTPEVE
ncbi:MAG: 50S ribosomal protein L22 [Caldisericia bacterium]|nr:50S ribosomal protein L22 [Caldisericia bacterium]